MKKRRFALSALLIMSLVVSIILSILPMSILAADTAEPALTGTKLTSAHAGATLAAGNYYVEPGATLTLKGGTGKSALKVAANSTVTIYIPEGSTLNVTGGNASGTTGAGAGIEVVSGSNLKIIGSGTLNATGGKAANGSSGANGETARWGDDDYSYIPDSGYGGAGGGGAGAGIGTKGGNGGSSTNWQIALNGTYYRTVWTDYFMDNNYSGSKGHNGKAGESASPCGGIYIQSGVTVNAKGGAAGTSGGAGGSAGSRDYESDDHDIRGLAGGAGGGGGGAGKAGAAYGTGGGGGGGGGAGGGIGYAWSCWFLGGGGGGGGAGAVGGAGGAWSSDGKIPDHDCGKYDGGKEASSLSGGTGGSSSGGTGGQGAKVKIRKTDSTSSSWQWPYGGNGGNGGSAGANCTNKSYETLYTVTVDDGSTTTVYYASADAEFLPETLAVQNQTGYTFKGYFADNTQYYTDEGSLEANAQITGDMTLVANFDVNKYNYSIVEKDPAQDTTNVLEEQTNAYTDSITLVRPEDKKDYLFRGWEISAKSGELNANAYYTYSTAPVMRMLRSSGQSEIQSFIRNGDTFWTIGSETDFNSVTLYNLSAEDGADIVIQERWEYDRFEITFNDFDGGVISEQSGNSTHYITAPDVQSKENEYYTYTLKHWKCNIDGKTYTTEQLASMNMDYFTSYESQLGEKVYTGIEFTAVYDIKYNKQLHLYGTLGNSGTNEITPDGKLVLNSGDTNVDVITNFNLTINEGVAALLLIPEYDMDAFSIKDISINGKLVYSNGQSLDPASTSTATAEILKNFDVSITGNEPSSDLLKILLDNTTPDSSTSEQDVFIQIVYTMKEAIGGEYKFGFVTNTPKTTDSIATHGDRSEAYGTYDPNASKDNDAYKFNELDITVDNSKITVIIRATGEITIADQSFVYNAQQITAADITDTTEYLNNVVRYTFNGYEKVGVAPLTITWYDANGNPLGGAPTNAGTYKIVISAVQTMYYTADQAEATVTIGKYQIFAVADDQSVEYTGINAVINTAPSQGGIFAKNESGEYIPADEFVKNDLWLTGVNLVTNYTDAGEYSDAITAILNNASNANYDITYVNGTLTITQAVNDWAGLDPANKEEEYTGSPISIDEVTANFGDVKVEYMVGKDTNQESWSENPPINAGTYPVKITVTGNNNYTDLSYEVTLVITKRVITSGDFGINAIDKIYNGEAQSWSILEYDANGNIETPSEIWLVVSDENADLLNYIKLAGLSHSQEYINAGEYDVTALLEISDPNYTFGKTWDSDAQVYIYEDTAEFGNVTVKILPREIDVAMKDQSATYSGSAPYVSQGKEYITTILPTGVTEDTEEYNALLTIIARDFFGEDSEREFYVPAIDYNENAEYYYLVSGAYERITFATKEEFDANKALGEAEDPMYRDVYTKVTLQKEDIVISKADGYTAGTYALYATLALGENSNYKIVNESGNFIIEKYTLELPTIEDTTYNGQEQSPSATDTEHYTIQKVVGTNAGVYHVLVVLKDKDNYQWKIDGAQENSDDQSLPWYIFPKNLTVVIPDITEKYVYSEVTRAEINEDIKLLNYTWENGVAPYDIDQIQVEFNFMVADEILDAYTYGYKSWEITVTGSGKNNYIIDHIGGNLTINPYELTKKELADLIKSEVKYYTDSAITWAVGDFTLSADYARILQLLSVGATNYKDANGTYTSEVFTHYKDAEDKDKQYFADVTLNVSDTNYKLADDITNNTLAIEVFIAKAQNEWVTAPSINAEDLSAIKTEAESLFGKVNVEYFTDEACTTPAKNMITGNTYYAKFTVEGTLNYGELSKVLPFNSSVIVVGIPVVYLGSGTIEYGNEYKKPYIGTSYRFDCDDHAKNSSWYKYEANFDGTPLTNAGTYTITFTLNNDNKQYKWEDGKTDPIVFTFIIEPAKLTIQPDDCTITYKDPAPTTYELVANGLVNNETLENLLSPELYAQLNQFVCSYQQGDNAGSYDIFACNNTDTIEIAIDDALLNYEVTFNKGTLTVKPLAVGYDDVRDPDDGTSLEDLSNSGISFVYDSESKEVTIGTLPEELEAVIVYKDKDGNILPNKPTNAGEYTVEITLKLKDESDAGNYDLPDDSATIILTIEKAQIKITVNDQEYPYDAGDHKSKFPMASEDKYSVEFVNTDNKFTFEVGTLTIIDGKYIDANEYKSVISIEYTESNNYVVDIVKGTLTILKADNTWVANLKVNDNLVYNKTAIQLGTDYSADPKFGDDEIKYTFYKKVGDSWQELSGAPSRAGTYAVKADVPGTTNYNELSSNQVEFVIKKATITIEDLKFEDATFIYNGQPRSISVIGEHTDAFTITYDGNEKTNAGTYTVTATFVLADEDNYELSGGANTMRAEMTIEAVRVTVTANSLSSEYGETLNELTYTLSFDPTQVGEEQVDSTFYTNELNATIALNTTATAWSDVNAYPITVTCAQNSNYVITTVDSTYTITQFQNNTITITVNNINYRMDLIYSSTAERGEDSVTYTFATSEAGPFTTERPTNVGSYYIKATIAETVNYKGAEAVATFTISPATLSKITDVSYDKDTATWTAVVTTTDGKTINCEVSYRVDGESLTVTRFTADKTGTFSVVAVPSGANASNYIESDPFTLAEVFSVKFADKVANHERQSTPADLSDSEFTEQYRFAGQKVTEPNKAPTVEGYTFRIWQLNDADCDFENGVKVNANITLYADWTVNKYTVTFYNDETEYKIENGSIVPGNPNYTVYSTIEVEYGLTVTLPTTDPTKDVNNGITYTFVHWSGSQGGDKILDLIVKGPLSLYAVYDYDTGTVTITYMLSIDGSSYEPYDTVVVTDATVLKELADKPWFLEDGWYTDSNRTNAIDELPVVSITLYGAYVFDIGAGDVNADGEIDVKDVILYRQYIVGGYNIEFVASGSEWQTVNSASFDPATTRYFVARVNDANRDDSGDIRDITTIRMALTGGYGYTYLSGLNSLAKVSGEAIVIESAGLSEINTPEGFKTALENGGIIKLTGNIALTETVTISEDTVIYLNGYDLDMSTNASRPFSMASNSSLVIHANDETITVGAYGLVNIPVGTDNVEVILNGGNYVASTDNGSFIKPRGEGKISIELNNVTLADTSDRNFAIDTSEYIGNNLSVNVTGGEYDVWTGFSFDGLSGNTYLLDGVTINSRYIGITAGGHDDVYFSLDAVANVTAKNCKISVAADFTKNTYSAEMACIVAGFGAQVEVTNSKLSSNVHIASICSGEGTCAIELNSCEITPDQTREPYKYHDDGSIKVNGVEQKTQ